jgi:hypothetical protein
MLSGIVTLAKIRRCSVAGPNKAIRIDGASIVNAEASVPCLGR